MTREGGLAEGYISLDAQRRFVFGARKSSIRYPMTGAEMRSFGPHLLELNIRRDQTPDLGSVQVRRD